VIGAAIMVGRIATGEIQEPKAATKSAASELARKGGTSRAKALSGKKRNEIAKKAAEARWK